MTQAKGNEGMASRFLISETLFDPVFRFTREETRNAISFPIWFPLVSRFAPYTRETRNEA